MDFHTNAVKLLEPLLQPLGFRVAPVRIRADGNCLFNVFAEFLHLHQDQQFNLRHFLANILETLLKDKQGQLEQLNMLEEGMQDWSTILKEFRRDGESGGTEAAAIFGFAFNTQVQVQTHNLNGTASTCN